MTEFLSDIDEIAVSMQCSPAWVLLFVPGMALLGVLAEPWSLLTLFKGDA